MTERHKSFPDKKHPDRSYREITELLKQQRQAVKEFQVGQREATWIPYSDYPNLPIAILLMSDVHYGSIGTDYELLDRHLDIVENTPNFYVATNGDEVDFFNAVKHATGMTENPISPQMQARTFIGKLRDMDRQNKIAVLGHGNHNDFGFVAGQDFYDSFMSEFQAPIFTTGGLLHILPEGGQHYKLLMNHTYWGRSKLNPTNACKRLMEYEGGGDVDVAWLGHVHQSSYEHFERAGKDVLAVVSGTYKIDDPFAAKRGIGGRGQQPGITLVLWPNERRIEAFKDIEIAQQYITGRVFEEERKNGNVIVIDKR